MPSVIPELSIHLVEEFFRFQWRENRFDLKLLIYCEGKYLSLKDFWELTDRQLKWGWLKEQATESMYEFGYVISDIPQDIANNVEYLVWKIEGASFDIMNITLENVELLEEGYNVTRIYLPDNLVLSYEDLWLYDFTVEHPSKTETVVKGVKGKTVWNLDPITYSAPTITVIGGTQGTPLDFKDIWDADQTGGWGVVSNNNNTDAQFEFNAKLVFGNGTTEGTTYLNDTEKQVVFNDGILSANGEYWMELTRYSYLQFGVLEDATEKTTSKGCSFTSLEATYTSYLTYAPNALNKNQYFYSCHINAKRTMYIAGKTLTLYNSICTDNIAVNDDVTSNVFNCQITQTGSSIYHPQGTWDKITITESTYVIYTTYEGTISNLYARENTYLARFNAFNIGDLTLIDCDSDTWALDWVSGTREMWRKYSFDLTVTYPNGTAIDGATVTIKHYGQSETEDYSGTTDASGQIAQQTFSMGFYNQTGANVQYSYNPYELNITYADYDTYLKNFTLSEQIAWEISMTEETEASTTTTEGASGLNEYVKAVIVEPNIRGILIIVGLFAIIHWIYKWLTHKPKKWAKKAKITRY